MEAAAYLHISSPSSAEELDNTSHHPVSGWLGLNAAAKVWGMISCAGSPLPPPNQYLITNKVKEISSKVIYNFLTAADEIIFKRHGGIKW